MKWLKVVKGIKDHEGIRGKIKPLRIPKFKVPFLNSTLVRSETRATKLLFAVVAGDFTGRVPDALREDLLAQLSAMRVRGTLGHTLLDEWVALKTDRQNAVLKGLVEGHWLDLIDTSPR
jgi:hypothetical protein